MIGLDAMRIAIRYAKQHGTLADMMGGADADVPGVRLYCGVNEKQWNHHAVAPGPFACVSPVFGKREGQSDRARESKVYVPPGTRVIQDSGAFCDGPKQRLDYANAYLRQLRHGRKHGYESQITHRASYDLLIDERWEDGQRHKERWREDLGWHAVDVSVSAAKWMAENEREKGRILSAQGVTPRQYLQCVEGVLPFIDPARDIFGLGGWCITGLLRHQIMPMLRETLRLCMPVIAAAGVRNVHIWGVIYPQALGELLWYGHQFGIQISTDSAGPAMNPAAYGRWGYGDWVDKTYKSPPAGCQCKALGRCRGLDRARHVALTRSWLESLHLTDYYRDPRKGQALVTVKEDPRQLTMFGRRAA